jgi:phage tail-like protein
MRKFLVVIVAVALAAVIAQFSGVLRFGADRVEAQAGGTPSFQYTVEVGGVSLGTLSNLDGLGGDTEIIEQKVLDPTGKEVIQKLPGRTKYPNIVLKQGVAPSKVLYDWWALNSSDSGKAPVRKNMSVILRDRNGSTVARYDLLQAWPTRWKAPALVSQNTVIPLEGFELSVDRAVRVE